MKLITRLKESLVKRYESCVGLSLPAIGRYKIEIWWAPKGYSIKPHTHDNVNIKLMFLFGNCIRFHRRESNRMLGESVIVRWKDIGRVFNIPAKTEHSFDVCDTPLIFLNFEKWLSKPTSASEDLHLTTT